ncbi:unnamed protein product, partial [Mesorhabditis belari]|uniref:TRAPP II complex TRAPPC10 C-terminal domain-containing protein n=1 Tax=Mesorhabditis belari TaxID=2138241 RepID=A0AAF3FED7_9BILA
MDYKWSINLSTLLKINKGLKTKISTKGNDTTTTGYLEAIVSHFTHNAIQVKRGNKTYPATFPLKVVPYDEKEIFSQQETVKFTSAPFLHIYFISSASVDEYRTSIRHNISEWFATLANKSDSQWLIVIDTTRAKEKKNRSQLIDKLKSDFSKHQQRLIEVSESVEHGSFSGLVQAVKTCLNNHYDILVDHWDKHLRQLKDNRHESWDIYHYANEHMEFARFFWSLGCLEYALKLYDELDAFCYTLLSTLPRENHPPWMSILSGSLEVCPKLSETVHLNQVGSEYQTFLGLRHLLVSQQMLITLGIYQQRLHSNSAAPSIRHDFAGIILRYASHCLQIVVEHGAFHEILPDKYQLAAWKIYLVSETFSLCDLLAEPSSVEGVTSATCHLHTSRFYSLLLLGELVFSASATTQREKFISWFGKTDSLLAEALLGDSSFLVQLQKSHDTTAVFLTQVGRFRAATALGASFATYLNKDGIIDTSLPYELKQACRLVENETYSEKNIGDIRKLIARLDPAEDRACVVTLLMFLCLQEMSPDEKDRQEFIDFVQTRSNSMINCLPIIKCPISVRIPRVGLSILMPGDEFSMTFKFISKFNFEIENCHFKVQMSSITQEILCKTRPPAFQMGYDKDERKALMTCIFSVSESKDEKKDKQHQEEIWFESSLVGTTLMPGGNDVVLTGQVTERGFYILNGISVFLMNQAIVLNVPSDAMTSRETAPALLVQKTPNKLDVEMPKILIAGMAQSICIILEAGMRQNGATEVAVETRTSDKMLKFRAGSNWEISTSLSVPSLQKGERHYVQLELFRNLDGRVIADQKEFKEKIFIEWMGQVWPVELTFSPLFTLSSTTTQLEASCLLETEISRPSDSIWTMIFHEADVKIITEEKNDNQANEQGETNDVIKKSEETTICQLINPELPIAHPSSLVALVWSLGAGSDEMLRCCITLSYSVTENNNVDDCSPNNEKYIFTEIMDVVSPKVEFELCAQMLSQHPGAQLCRAGAPCDMVINIRSLTNRIHVVYARVSADKEMWNVPDSAKILQIKDSGIAQVAFTVVPLMAGFLPFPSVDLFNAETSQQRSGDGFWSEEFTEGSNIITFQRTTGKQIRVLGGIEKHQNDRDFRDNRSFRVRFGKLFD